MKIPIESPFENLEKNIQTTKKVIINAIEEFRENIINNRDKRNQRRKQSTNHSDVRDLAIVPYESKAKAVDSESFVYAMSSALAESQEVKKQKYTLTHYLRLFIYYPIYAFVATIIIVLVIYISILFIQVSNNNQQPIETPKRSTKVINHN